MIWVTPTSELSTIHSEPEESTEWGLETRLGLLASTDEHHTPHRSSMISMPQFFVSVNSPTVITIDPNELMEPTTNAGWHRVTRHNSQWTCCVRILPRR